MLYSRRLHFIIPQLINNQLVEVFSSQLLVNNVGKGLLLVDFIKLDYSVRGKDLSLVLEGNSMLLGRTSNRLET